jgi:hypothetical protein
LHEYKSKAKSIDKALQALFKPCIKTKRALFKSFGVSLLDGLKLFETFKDYCIVSVGSILFNDVMAYQEQALTRIRIALLQT